MFTISSSCKLLVLGFDQKTIKVLSRISSQKYCKDDITDEDEETGQEETNPHTSYHWNILKREDQLLFGLLNSLIQ